jgi:hypothetical protein
MQSTLFRTGLLLLVLGVLGAVVTAQDGRSPLPARDTGRKPDLAVVDRGLALQRIDRVLAGLEELASPRARRGPRAPETAGLSEELRRLRREVEHAPAVEKIPAPEAERSPMAEREFASFLESVRRASFADDKVALVRRQAKLARFTSAQVAALVKAIPPWGRVDAATAVYPRVVDPDHFHLVFRELAFASDREELSRRIEKLAGHAKSSVEK